MEKLLPIKEPYGKISSYYEDYDFIDRLNNRWTIRLLMLCILIVSGNIFVGKQINCWTPNELNNPQIDYANSICWLHGSYYLPTEEITIPHRSKPREYFVSYYQWTPFIFLLMAFPFMLSQMFWRACSRGDGVNIRYMVNQLKQNSNSMPVKSIEENISKFKSYLRLRNNYQGRSCFYLFNGKMCGHFTLAYCAVKLFYMINAFLQFSALKTFLLLDFPIDGLESLNELLTDKIWQQSPRFPLVTMCDFMIRRLGSNQHWYSVQCNLPVNLYNEKLFLIIRLWLLLLFVLNICSIIYLIILLMFLRPKRIKEYLKISKCYNGTNADAKKSKESEEESIGFLKYLGVDGYLIVTFIANNTDQIIGAEVIGQLYQDYKNCRSGNQTEPDKFGSDGNENGTLRSDGSEQETRRHNEDIPKSNPPRPKRRSSSGRSSTRSKNRQEINDSFV